MMVRCGRLWKLWSCTRSRVRCRQNLVSAARDGSRACDHRHESSFKLSPLTTSCGMRFVLFRLGHIDHDHKGRHAPGMHGFAYHSVFHRVARARARAKCNWETYNGKEDPLRASAKEQIVRRWSAHWYPFRKSNMQLCKSTLASHVTPANQMDIGLNKHNSCGKDCFGNKFASTLFHNHHARQISYIPERRPSLCGCA